MSYIVLFFLIIGGCVLGAPVPPESIQFRFVDCIPGENETSKHVLEITDFNETCVRVNQLSPAGNQVRVYYIIPQTENGAQLRIITENCSTPLPDLHLSLCHDHDDDQTNDNSTEIMVTFGFSNISNIDTLNNNNNSDDTATIDTHLFTGPTVYETLHQLDQDSITETNLFTGPIVYETLHQLDQDSITETNLFTGPTVYETLHQLDQDSDEEHNNIINTLLINDQEVGKSDQSSESEGV